MWSCFKCSRNKVEEVKNVNTAGRKVIWLYKPFILIWALIIIKLFLILFQQIIESLTYNNKYIKSIESIRAWEYVGLIIIFYISLVLASSLHMPQKPGFPNTVQVFQIRLDMFTKFRHKDSLSKLNSNPFSSMIITSLLLKL